MHVSRKCFEEAVEESMSLKGRNFLPYTVTIECLWHTVLQIDSDDTTTELYESPWENLLEVPHAQLMTLTNSLMALCQLIWYR